MRASHLVAPVIFDEGVLALVAVSDESSRHGLFHNMPHGELTILPGFVAAHWNMRLLFAQAAASLPALGVHASELLVNLNRQTFGFEVAKWAFREKVQSSRSQILLLLHML